MKKGMRGSFTIEAAVIIPVILFIFGSLLHILFYWHDKNILMGAIHETATLGSSRCELSELELEYEFFDRVEGILLSFDRVECIVCLEEGRVTVACAGSKDRMATKIQCSVKRTNPEKYIRKIQRMKKIGEGIGE